MSSPATTVGPGAITSQGYELASLISSNPITYEPQPFLVSSKSIAFAPSEPAAMAPAQAQPSPSGPSFWQRLVAELFAPSTPGESDAFAKGFQSGGSAYRSGSVSLPGFDASAYRSAQTSIMASASAGASGAQAAYDRAGRAAESVLSAASGPLGLQASLFRLPPTPALVGPFGETSSGAGPSVKTMLVVGALAAAGLVIAKKVMRKKPT